MFVHKRILDRQWHARECYGQLAVKPARHVSGQDLMYKGRIRRCVESCSMGNRKRGPIQQCRKQRGQKMSEKNFFHQKRGQNVQVDKTPFELLPDAELDFSDD